MNYFMFHVILFIMGFNAPIAWFIQGGLLLLKPEYVGDGRHFARAGVLFWLLRLLIITII